MRVLLLGATGNVGSRLLPSLIAHGHEVIVFVRNTSKLPTEATSCATAIVSGSATDSDRIKETILSNHCDAIINAAGVAPMLGQKGELPAIFKAVSRAAVEARRERGGPALRCWFLSGFGIMESPKKPHMLIDYVPIFTIHRQNLAYIRSVPSEELAWSLFCANQMDPRSPTVNYSPKPGVEADNLVAGVESPPAWSKTLQWVPLVGTYLNVLMQMQHYFTPLEDCVDFIASDLAAGLDSEYVGHRVGVKSKSKAA
ncbi:hypothetical protein LTR56_009110 [Elasticomyces elasticus]|nr:hypothetical protein LTR56_009110 [Elasticomyces elasticus]KAK3660652.1 hypothetical protein LTR22_007899 [Elasticomyces elasticus]KAK4912486.1 hypothetical protein LTR49_019100 [Elasticomyces elasticus]KAK5766948.1 hypothetical protein LTS12_003024 [Elasticomyces elasticus]